MAGSLLVVDKFQASVSVIDLPTGELVARIPVGHGPHELAVSPDETSVLVTNYGFTSLSNSVTYIDLDTLKPVYTHEFKEPRRPHDIWWTEGSRAWISSEGTQSVIEFDVATKEIMREYDVGEPTAHMIAPDFAKNRLFTANILAGSVTMIDLSAPPPGAPETTKLGAAGEGIALHHRRDQLWITDGPGNAVRIVDAQTLEVLAELPCKGMPHRVRFTLDGDTALVSCLLTNDIAVFDLETRKLESRIPNDAGAVISFFPAQIGAPPDTSLPSAIRLHHDRQHAFIANINSNTVTVIDLQTMTTRGVIRCGFGADGMAITHRRYGDHARDREE